MEVHLKEKVVLISVERSAPQKKLVKGTFSVTDENSSK